MPPTVDTAQHRLWIEIIEDLELSRAVNRTRLQEAFDFAVQAYGDSLHTTSVPVLEHSLQVLKLLLPFKPDEETIIGCLLHHTLDARAISLADIEAAFGPSVCSMVSGIHLISQVTSRPRRTPIEQLRLMLIRLSSDVRVLLVLLCEQVMLLDVMQPRLLTDARRVARDALRLFAPVAARLGVYSLKHTLETKAFPLLYPDDAERLEGQLTIVHRRYGSFLKDAATNVRTAIEEYGIPCVVEAREKQSYSIFMKMQSKNLTDVTDLYDLFAFRIVVNTSDDCYRVLGLLHKITHPIQGRFKDYIAFPKPNGYQSLHTTVTGLPDVPAGVFAEIQIRTQEMHREAELGVAAHWNYKSFGVLKHATLTQQLPATDTDQRIVADGVQASYVDHIFVLTPKGDVIELPEGATPLDFAFQVHTELGLSFRLARVNGNAVPLNHELHNGDIVEILKHAQPKPSPRWFHLLKTASARSRLRRYLLQSTRQQLHDTSHEVDNISAKTAQSRPRIAVSPRSNQIPVQYTIQTDLDVPLPITIARCCSPDTGDKTDIVGVITRHRTIRVHRARCHLLHQVQADRQIDVWWSSESNSIPPVAAS